MAAVVGGGGRRNRRRQKALQGCQGVPAAADGRGELVAADGVLRSVVRGGGQRVVSLVPSTSAACRASSNPAASNAASRRARQRDKSRRDRCLQQGAHQIRGLLDLDHVRAGQQRRRASHVQPIAHRSARHSRRRRACRDLPAPQVRRIIRYSVIVSAAGCCPTLKMQTKAALMMPMEIGRIRRLWARCRHFGTFPKRRRSAGLRATGSDRQCDLSAGRRGPGPAQLGQPGGPGPAAGRSSAR